jgi:heterotetrameric sarcosine oxidase gamma subunit
MLSPAPLVAGARGELGCLLVRCAADAAEVVPQLNAVTKIEFPREPGQTMVAHGMRAIWISPQSWLLHCRRADERSLTARINDAFPGRAVHASLYGDSLCWIEICGPGAPEILAEGDFISLERQGLAVAHAKRTRFASLPAVVVRETEGSWLVGVERSRAQYLADWLAAARQRAAALAD